MYEIFKRYDIDGTLMMLHIIGYILAMAFVVFVISPLHNFAKTAAVKRFGDDDIVARGDYGFGFRQSFSWVGFISMTVLRMGFSKPVDYMREKFKHPVLAPVSISFIGISVYFLFAIVFAFFYSFFRNLGLFGITTAGSMYELTSAGSVVYFLFYAFIFYTTRIMIMFTLINLIPLPPLDFGDILLPILRPTWIDGIKNNELLISAGIFVISFLTIAKPGGFLDELSTDCLLILNNLNTSIIGIFS